MFSRKFWKFLSLSALGVSCAIAFNACAPSQVSRNPSPANQAVAMAQPPMTSAELNGRLLSVLPPVDQTETTEEAQAVSPAQAVAPEPRTPAPAAPPLLSPAASAPQPRSEPQAIAFSNRGAAQTRYGHYPYAEAYRENLTVAGYYGSRPEQLHQDASGAFKLMVAAAKQEGVHLMAVSGFRDVGIQSELFAAQTARQGSPERAARISASPGHSEHHTGFAIDVGDEGYPNTDIEVSFEQTPGFRRMAQNAAAYGFELSFPRGNAQGVSYEPWHWRFVGTATAQRIFAQAR